MRAPLCIWIGCILVCSLFLNARAETELAGTISANSTLTSAQSPYTLTGTLYVSDNATLTIQSGVEIDMNGNDIWFGYSTSSGHIDASGAEFTGEGGRIKFYLKSSGTISGCTLDSVTVYLDNSEVEITGCTIQNVEYPVEINDGGAPRMSGNTYENVIYKKVAYTGYVCKIEWTIPECDIPYLLKTDHLQIETGGAVTIEPGVEIDMGGQDVYIYSGTLSAEDVTFSGSGGNEINLRSDESGSSLKNCVLDRVAVDLSGGGSEVTGCEIRGVEYPFILNSTGTNELALAGNVFTDVTYEGIKLSMSATSDYTLQDFGLDYFVYSAHGGMLEVTDGATLTISSGVRILMDKSVIVTNGYLSADGVEFIGTSSVLNESIVFSANGSGCLTNCLLDSLYVSMEGGSPEITGCDIKNVHCPFILKPGSRPELSGNTFTNVTYEKIALNGIITEDCTLEKLPFDFTMYVGYTYSLSIMQDATLTIEPNIDIYMPGIKVGGQYGGGSGNLDADSVSFHSGSVLYYSGGGGTVSNSTLENMTIGVYSGNPVITGCAVLQGNPRAYGVNNLGLENTISAENNYWGYPSGPSHSSNPGGQGAKVSDMVDFDPWLIENPIKDNKDPVALFTVTPDSGYVSTVFEFDASESYDEEDSVTGPEVRWDWEDDGEYDTDWSETRTATHQYAEPGEYTVRLQARDSDDATGSATEYVTVLEEADDNTPPAAAFTVTPEGGSVETEFAFDASASSDAEDGTTGLKYSWDWDNDDTWDISESSSSAAAHTFSEKGTYIVTLRVTDSEGLAGETSHTVMVGDITISEFTIIHTISADSLSINFAIRNNGGEALKDLRYRGYIGSSSNAMNGAEEPIAELAPNRGQRCQLTGHIGHDSPNTEVTVEIYEINGASFDISVSETFSAYYVRNMNSGKSGRAYDLSMDAYTFENSSLSYTEWRNWLWTFKDLDVLRAIGMLITGVTGGLEGRCHGYAATSNRFLMYENEKPVAKETGDMTLSDDGVSELISRYFIRQVYEPEAPYETGMQEAVNKLKFRFAVDEPVMILFTDHTIAAYKLLVREEKDEAYLYFYDSNYPEQARAGIMRWGENNSFEYEEYSKFAMQMAVAPPTEAQVSEAVNGVYSSEVSELRGSGKIFAGAASPVRMWVEDNTGRIAGYPEYDSVLVNTIPGAEIMRIENPGADSLTFFYLPNTLTYTTYIAAADTGKMDFSIVVPVSGTEASGSYFQDVPLTSTEWNAVITVSDTVVSDMIVDYNGDGTYDDIVTAVVSEDKGEGGYGINRNQIPTGYVLSQNYPNPFNPATSLSFSLPVHSTVTVSVYDLTGHHVRTLISRSPCTAGNYTITWDGANKSGIPVASGVYLYTLRTTGGISLTKKMMLLK